MSILVNPVISPCCREQLIVITQHCEHNKFNLKISAISFKYYDDGGQVFIILIVFRVVFLHLFSIFKCFNIFNRFILKMSTENRDSVLQSSIKGAKYVPLDKDKWERNIAKKRRISGLDYVGVNSKRHVAGKTFAVIKKCCIKECCKKFENTYQKEMFNSFYSMQSKESQDIFMASCISLKEDQVRKRKTVDPAKERNFTWNYILKKSGSDITVCRQFILSLYQLSEKRIRLIQQKIRDDDSFVEKRGNHGKQKKFCPNVWSLAMDHLKNVPHRQSHYSQAKSNRLYFLNPDLNIKDLYEAFKTFFEEKTETKLEMKYKIVG